MMRHLTLVHSRQITADLDRGFSARDHMTLTSWMQDAAEHGYRRMLIERGSEAGGPEEGGYVLVYAPTREWATWGLARSGDDIVVWHCGTGVDLGRFSSMRAALESLPPVAAERECKSPELRRPAARFSLVHSR
jgi:hypothetical protein